jgi:hypothetical protein
MITLLTLGSISMFLQAGTNRGLSPILIHRLTLLYWRSPCRRREQAVFQYGGIVDLERYNPGVTERILLQPMPDEDLSDPVMPR